MPTTLARIACLILLAAGLGACGRTAALDVPVAIDQAIPGTPEDAAARNPPRGPDGRVVLPRTQPRVTPLGQSFPLDPILN